MALPSTIAFDFPTVDAIAAFVSATPDEVRDSPFESELLRTDPLLLTLCIALTLLAGVRGYPAPTGCHSRSEA